MRVRVKICGITTVEAAHAAAEAGADAVGFVFAKSPRRVDVAQAARLGAGLPPFVARVAVFHHPSAAEVAHVIATVNPDLVQAEPDTEVIGALRGRHGLLPVFHDGPDLLQRVTRLTAGHAVTGVLLEASGRGGRGLTPDWGRAAQVARDVPLVLAGGLTPSNVAQAIRQVKPYAVDVSSGVESSKGIKDPMRIAAFVEAVRDAEASIGLGAIG